MGKQKKKNAGMSKKRSMIQHQIALAKKRQDPAFRKQEKLHRASSLFSFEYLQRTEENGDIQALIDSSADDLALVGGLNAIHNYLENVLQAVEKDFRDDLNANGWITKACISEDGLGFIEEHKKDKEMLAKKVDELNKK